MRGIENGKESKGIVIPFDSSKDRFIIFSDQHKGAKNGADDFMLCEPNYLAALDYYLQNNFQLIVLGDCEELWENTLSRVVKQQEPSFNRYKQLPSLALSPWCPCVHKIFSSFSAINVCRRMPS